MRPKIKTPVKAHPLLKSPAGVLVEVVAGVCRAIHVLQDPGCLADAALAHADVGSGPAHHGPGAVHGERHRGHRNQRHQQQHAQEDQRFLEPTRVKGISINAINEGVKGSSIVPVIQDMYV